MVPIEVATHIAGLLIIDRIIGLSLMVSEASKGYMG